MTDAEGAVARLEAIILDQQAAMKVLETRVDRLLVERARRGETNARLNKENAQLKAALRAYTVTR